MERQRRRPSSPGPDGRSVDSSASSWANESFSSLPASQVMELKLPSSRPGTPSALSSGPAAFVSSFSRPPTGGGFRRSSLPRALDSASSTAGTPRSLASSGLSVSSVSSMLPSPTKRPSSSGGPRKTADLIALPSLPQPQRMVSRSPSQDAVGGVLRPSTAPGSPGNEYTSLASDDLQNVWSTGAWVEMLKREGCLRQTPAVLHASRLRSDVASTSSGLDVGRFLDAYRRDKRSNPAAVVIQRIWRTHVARRTFVQFRTMVKRARMRSAANYFHMWKNFVKCEVFHRGYLLRVAMRSWKGIRTRKARVVIPHDGLKLYAPIAAKLIKAYEEQQNQLALGLPLIVPTSVAHIRLSFSELLDWLTMSRNYAKSFYRLMQLALEKRKRLERLATTMGAARENIMKIGLRDKLRMWHRWAAMRKSRRRGQPFPYFVPWLDRSEEMQERYLVWYARQRAERELKETVARLGSERRLHRAVAIWQKYTGLRRNKSHLNAKLETARKAKLQRLFALWHQQQQQMVAVRLCFRRCFFEWRAFVRERIRIKSHVALMAVRRDEQLRANAFLSWKQQARVFHIVSAAHVLRLRTNASLALKYGFIIESLVRPPEYSSRIIFLSAWRNWSARAKRRVLFKRFLLAVAQAKRQQMLRACFEALRMVVPRRRADSALRSLPTTSPASPAAPTVVGVQFAPTAASSPGSVQLPAAAPPPLSGMAARVDEIAPLLSPDRWTVALHMLELLNGVRAGARPEKAVMDAHDAKWRTLMERDSSLRTPRPPSRAAVVATTTKATIDASAWLDGLTDGATPGISTPHVIPSVTEEQLVYKIKTFDRLGRKKDYAAKRAKQFAADEEDRMRKFSRMPPGKKGLTVLNDALKAAFATVGSVLPLFAQLWRVLYLEISNREQTKFRDELREQCFNPRQIRYWKALESLASLDAFAEPASFGLVIERLERDCRMAAEVMRYRKARDHYLLHKESVLVDAAVRLHEIRTDFTLDPRFHYSRIKFPALEEDWKWAALRPLRSFPPEPFATIPQLILQLPNRSRFRSVELAQLLKKWNSVRQGNLPMIALENQIFETLSGHFFQPEYDRGLELEDQFGPRFADLFGLEQAFSLDRTLETGGSSYQLAAFLSADKQ
eukprot:TRINITY_DN8447_c0_g1_i1.p1 TRINITY_DN8447_c0_g1~~TRINITY_DN8447_c0_g1_i1.p1  ORF type:complete len:1128 (-),score=350.46 TRINITY_DN8447_c0_g1_i1:117-3500(-)